MENTEEKTEKTHYTLQEANQMIPELQLAFIRIHQMQSQIQSLFKHIKSMGIDFIPKDNRELMMLHDSVDEGAIDLLSSVKVLLANIQNEVNTLNRKGCNVSSIENGAVCWPTQLSDRSVMFSWQVGESRITHWQEDEDNDRRPLSELSRSTVETA